MEIYYIHYIFHTDIFLHCLLQVVKLLNPSQQKLLHLKNAGSLILSLRVSLYLPFHLNSLLIVSCISFTSAVNKWAGSCCWSSSRSSKASQQVLNNTLGLKLCARTNRLIIKRPTLAPWAHLQYKLWMIFSLYVFISLFFLTQLAIANLTDLKTVGASPGGTAERVFHVFCIIDLCNCCWFISSSVWL